MISWILDTGPLVAYLASTDPAHAKVTLLLDGFSGLLLTTSAVVTEAMYFVASVPRGPRVLAEFLAASGAQVHDFTQPRDLGEAVALMEKYADTPMDYADATLVLLAERLNVLDVLTLDRRGFSVYRTRRRQALRQVLQQR